MNGLPIYAKGSNAIPMDVVPSRGRAPDALRRLVRDAVSANQNMLRVWGGTQLSLNLTWKHFAIAVTAILRHTTACMHPFANSCTSFHQCRLLLCGGRRCVPIQFSSMVGVRYSIVTQSGAPRSALC